MDNVKALDNTNALDNTKVLDNNEPDTKKKIGRPRKIVDYDSIYVINFLQLFIPDAKSWNDCIGKIVKYNDLVERDIYRTFIQENMQEKLKKVLPIGHVQKFRHNNKIDCINDLILLLREIARKKNMDIIKNDCNNNDRKKYIFGTF